MDEVTAYRTPLHVSYILCSSTLTFLSIKSFSVSTLLSIKPRFLSHLLVCTQCVKGYIMYSIIQGIVYPFTDLHAADAAVVLPFVLLARLEAVAVLSRDYLQILWKRPLQPPPVRYVLGTQGAILQGGAVRDVRLPAQRCGHPSERSRPL